MPLVMDFWEVGTKNKIRGKAPAIDLAKFYADLRNTCKYILDEGIACGEFRKHDTLMTASAIMAVIDGLLLQWVLDHSLFDLETIGKKALNVILRGIKK